MKECELRRCGLVVNFEKSYNEMGVGGSKLDTPLVTEAKSTCHTT